MIDFTTSQLTWIVVGACTLGGTGYMTVNESMQSLDKNVAVMNNNMINQSQKIELLQMQLTRIEEKLDKQKQDK